MPVTFEEKYPKRDLVCFESAFRYEGAPNITHATLDGERTLCGRSGWATTEGWYDLGPCCLKCSKILEKKKQD